MTRRRQSVVLPLLLIAGLMALPPLARAQQGAATSQPAAPGQAGGISRKEVRAFDRFLDGHPKTARALRKDPSLIDNPDFLAKHHALQKFLGAHPGLRESVKQNPTAFMKREKRFARHEPHKG